LPKKEYKSVIYFQEETMAKNLIIVESPTKAKTIGEILDKRNYTVCATMGHLRDLPKSSLGVDTDNDFEPRYINIRGKGDLIKNLKTLAKKSQKIYLATDPDREGEAISWHLTYILGLDPKEKCRIEFHEIAADAVKKALKHPHPIDMDKVDAQQTRRILDRIMGYGISGLIQKKLSCRKLSGGRVQSVAVKIIADREKEIAAFVPKEYWTLGVMLRKNSKSPVFEAEAVRYKGKKLELNDVKEARMAENVLKKADYVVRAASKNERKIKALPPFTTSTLQQEANRKLGFSAKKTMSLAQQLYEGVSMGKTQTGLITYMRTDSVRFADSACRETRNYIEKEYGKEYLPARANVFSSRKNAQDAHEAIRPTSIWRVPKDMADYLTRDQQRLYELIWKRSVASQMCNAVYDVTRLDINAGDYELRTSGSTLKFPGFMKVTGKADGDEKEKMVPHLAAGTRLQLHKPLPAKQHFTEPPAVFTEASLVKKLEEDGIGRPSTYAPTIQTILDRGYVGMEGRKLVTRDLGRDVLEMMTPYFSDFINEKFSSDMETELDEIAEHKADKNSILHRYYNPFTQALDEAYEKITQVYPIDTGILCDKCKKHNMMIRCGMNGKFVLCGGFPECRNGWAIGETTGVKCPECGGKIIELQSKKGRTYYKCENNRNDDQSCSFISYDRPTGKKCEVCGEMMVEHTDRSGRKRVFCMNQDCPNGRPVKKAKSKKKK